MNKGTETKYRDDLMEIQYDGSSSVQCVSEPLNHRSQLDFSAFQDKEMMIKPLKI